MDYVLINYSCDYADEFDVKGSVVMPKDEWREHVQLLDNVDFPIEKYFGTNESIEYQDKEDYLSSFTVVPLTRQDANVLLKYFPHGTGTVLMLEPDDNYEDDEDDYY